MRTTVGVGFRRLRRTSPTPDELRSQAWHGLANRITSLYWFNLSLPSLAAFPDLIEPIARVNREVGMLEEIFLRGEAFESRRLPEGGKPGWELCSIVSDDTALYVVHDLGYEADVDKRVFRFEERVAPALEYRLPSWLTNPLHVFEVDADGTRDVASNVATKSLTIEGGCESARRGGLHRNA